MVFTTEEFLGVVIESWPEWDLNPSTTTEFRSDAKGDWITELSGHYIYIYIVFIYIYIVFIYI